LLTSKMLFPKQSTGLRWRADSFRHRRPQSPTSHFGSNEKTPASQLEPIYYCQNGWKGLAHCALKLYTHWLNPGNHFENHTSEISRPNCIICIINCSSTLTLIQILFQAWCTAVIRGIKMFLLFLSLRKLWLILNWEKVLKVNLKVKNALKK